MDEQRRFLQINNNARGYYIVFLVLISVSFVLWRYQVHTNKEREYWSSEISKYRSQHETMRTKVEYLKVRVDKERETWSSTEEELRTQVKDLTRLLGQKEAEAAKCLHAKSTCESCDVEQKRPVDDLKDHQKQGVESCPSEKRKYELSEKRLKEQIRELTAELKEEMEACSYEISNYKMSERGFEAQIRNLTAELKEERERRLSERRKHVLSEESSKTKRSTATGGSEKKVSAPFYVTKFLYTVLTESVGHFTMSLIDDELFVIDPETAKGMIIDRESLSKKSVWNVENFYSIARNSLCKKNKYVYVSTTRNMIIKYDSEGDIVAVWYTENVNGRPSLTADCNVAFIPHDGTSRIFIYTPYGVLIRKIQLKLDNGGARLNCAIELPNGNFLISYGTDSDAQHGVSLIDSKGNVLRSFGGEKGKGKNQVNGVYDLVVEQNGDVIVVDHNNNRILRLNSNLEYQKEVLSAERGVKFPHGAVLDVLHGRLFVMGSTWDVNKAALSPGKIFVFEIK